MSRRLAAIAALGACAFVLLAALAGCAKKKILVIDNLPPETSVFVQGQVDTVAGYLRLYWFGSDPDGEIAGFEIRLLNSTQPAESAWVFTTRTDSLFTVFNPGGFTAPRLEVRAIDGEGLRDPTPARQDFFFTNQAPVVTITQRLAPTDTTYASLTFTWTAGDPDGDGNAMRFLVGLDTVPSALQLVNGRSLTIDTTSFKIGGVFPTTRPRQVFIRAVDGGGMLSAWDSMRWVVRAPSAPGVHARLLLIDNVPSTNGANAQVDTLWLNNVARSLPAGSFSILKLEQTQPFRSATDVLQTFRLFDAVVWYRANETGFSTLLANYQDAIAQYLDGGGRVVIESLNLIEGENATGFFREDWVTRYLGSTALIRAPRSGFVDSTVVWSITAGYSDSLGPDNPAVLRNIYLRSPAYADSMWHRSGPPAGLRGFEVRDTNNVALWAPDSALSPRVPRSIPIAVTVPVPESPPGTGRIVVFTVPIRGNFYPNMPRFLFKVFQQLGVTGPPN